MHFGLNVSHPRYAGTAECYHTWYFTMRFTVVIYPGTGMIQVWRQKLAIVVSLYRINYYQLLLPTLNIILYVRCTYEV